MFPEGIEKLKNNIDLNNNISSLKEIGVRREDGANKTISTNNSSNVSQD